MSNLINNEFKSKIEYILNDINMYMNVVFNFLYINKLFYLNLNALRSNYLSLTSLLKEKIKAARCSLILNKKASRISYSLIAK